MSMRGFDYLEERGFFPRFGGGGGGGNSVTYTNLLPTYIPGFQDWTEEYLTEAATLAAGNFFPYPDPTYAAQNLNETDGIAKVAFRGRYGSQVELDGKAHLRDLYDGLKINQNTKLDAFMAAKLEELMEEMDWEILPTIRMNHSFAWGGSEHNIAEAKAAAVMMRKINEFSRMYYEDYQQERDLQEHGMIHATPYGLQCIRDMEMLRTAGVYVREYLQGSYTDAWEQHNENQILAMRNLDILGNAVRTILSTYREQTTKYYKPSTMAQIAGIAMTGLSLYSMFSGTALNPYSKGLPPGQANFQQGLAQGGTDFFT